jgi:hypothetical protein
MQDHEIFSIAANDITRLSPGEAVNLFRDLLWSEAMECEIRTTLVSVPGAITVKDGGIDAVVAESPQKSGQGLIKKGHTSYQIKTGKFALNKKGIKEILYSETTGELKPGVQNCLDSNGTLVIVLFGNDSPTPSEAKIVSAMREQLKQISRKYGKARINVWRVNNLLNFLKPYPALVLQINHCSSKAFLPHDRWAQISEMGLPLKMGPSQMTLMESIRAAMRQESDSSHIVVQGEAGAGKTRLVLETTRPDDLRPYVIYIDKPESLLSSDMLDYITWKNEHARVILVVDECDSQKRAEIWNRLKTFASRIKFISIYNEIEVYTQIPRFEAILLAEEQIMAILMEYRLTSDQARRWAEYCGGSPRVAHVVGANLRNNPEDILRVPGTVDIWNRYIVGSDGPHSELVSKRRLVLVHLALFKRFGVRKPFQNEAKAILCFIQRVQPHFSQADFLSIINEQQKRKNLQGNTTLYLSPKLFHIKLWVDWWETYGSTFEWTAINELPDRLRDWFIEMFEYAKASNAADHVVRELLEPGGVFGNWEIYQTKRGANFFFQLVKSNPRKALDCLECAMQHKTREQLLDFKEGRREVITSLELIAIHKGLFVRAAKLLLALAEAENETWANNATGVFAALFSSGYGHVAPSEAAPLEKLPLLAEVLESENNTLHHIALKACDAALEAENWTRMVGNVPAGLGREPERWAPKTYGEVWDGYIAVWKLIEKHLDGLSEENRRFAITILLKRTRSLIRRTGLADMVLGTLKDLAARTDVKQKDVVSTVEKIVHYDGKRLRSEVLEKINMLKKEFVRDDFGSLLRRYVGMDLIEDNFDEQGNRRDLRDVIIPDLAQKSVQNPTILFPELKWLITNEAENGYRFGYELGKVDAERVFINQIIECQKQCKSNCSVFFLTGYGRAVYERSSEVWEGYLADFSQDENLYSSIPELIWRTGATSQMAIDILNGLIEGQKLPIESVRRFAFGGLADTIAGENFERWINLLLAKGTREAISAAAELFYTKYVWRREARDEGFPADLALTVLTHVCWFEPCDTYANDMDDYNWTEIAKCCVDNSAAMAMTLAKIMLENLGKSGGILETSFSHPLEALHRIAEKYPVQFWEELKGYLDPPINTRSFHLRHWINGALDNSSPVLPLIPPDLLWKWVDSDVRKRAALLAGIVPKSWFPEGGDKVCLARQLLVRYGDRKDVRAELRCNFASGSWWGPESAHLAANKQFLLNIKRQESNYSVQRWIDEYIDSLEPSLERAKIMEERDDW